MTVSVVGSPVQSTTNSGANNITGSNGLTLGSAPSAGDVALLVIKSTRSAGARTVSTVSGIGATWAAGYTGTRISYWLGTGTLTTGSITVTLSAAGNAQATLYIIRGLTANTIAGVTGNGTGTSRSGTAQTANLGQIAVAATTVILGTLTYPSAQTPSGWTAPGNVALGTETIGDAYRIPAASASHSTDASTTSSSNIEITSIVLGAAAPPHGSGTGAFTWAGTGAGHKVCHGVGTGAFTWAGSSAGHKVPRGSGTGAFAWAGAASGTTTPEVPHGPGAGAFTWAGTGTGHAELSGSGVGAFTWAGTGVGGADLSGSGTGAFAWAGSGSGTTPAPGGNAGTGAFAWAGAATGHNGVTTLEPWTADQSGQATGGLTAPDAPILLTPPLADPPMVPFVERAVGVQVHDMPPITVVNGRAVRSPGPVVDPDYTVTRTSLGVPHLLVDGIDVTYWRGIPSEIHSYSLVEPGGEEVAEVSFPQVTPFDSTGEAGDELYWLGADRDLEIVFVEDDGTRHSAWNGILVSDESQIAARSAATDWQAVGLLFGQASATMHQVPTYQPPIDRGHLVVDLLNAIPGRRFAPLARVDTGKFTRLRGSAGESVWDFVKRVLAEAWTDEGEQWTVRRTGPKQYAMVLKDDTVDYIVEAGQPGVAATLSRDKTQAPNVIFGRGRNSNGGYWEYRRYPDLLLEPAPAFPGTITVGSSGAGVSSAQGRMSAVGYDVPIDGSFSTSDAAVISRMQADYGLTATGNIDSATWAMLFDVGPLGADLDGSYRLPLAIDPKVDPYFRAPNGVIIGDRPDYDPKVQRTEVDLDFGTDISFGEAADQARKMLPREENAGVTGSLTLTVDPMVPGGGVTFASSRFLINSGATIEYRNFRGGDFSTGFDPWKLRSARVTVNLDSMTVGLDADSKRRDAMTLASIMRRDRDAQADPARRPGNPARRSRQAPDSIVEYDDEARGGIIPEHFVTGGTWHVIPRHLATVGRIAKFEWQLQTRGAVAMFATEITEAQCNAWLGNPLAVEDMFDAHLAELEPFGIIDGFGRVGDAMGYYPGQESQGDSFSGSFKTTNTIEYESGHAPWIWFCYWVTSDGNVSGRIYPSNNP